MDDFSKYSWHRLYMAAVLETDDTPIAWRIVTAYDAIEQRAAYVEPDGEQSRAMEQVKSNLVVLRRSDCGRGGSINGTAGVGG